MGPGMIASAVRARAASLNPYSVSIAVTGPTLVIGALLQGSTPPSN
jgi:hypothetical protein